ncbi:MAG: hypothetical protein U9N13_01145 [Euryarchaeota archaeon]|nr:hypothetical protein [Euryarchaeota archaeon]
MAKLEIKTIKGNKYLYIKDKVKVNSKNLPISLYVGRFEKTDINAFSEKLVQLVNTRLTKHNEYWKKRKHYYLNEAQVSNIEKLHFDYQRFKTYYPDETKVYEDNVYTRYVSGTTAIEGNTITDIEAGELIEHGVTPAGKSVREIYEIVNFTTLRRVLQSYNGDITEAFVKRIHEVLM